MATTYSNDISILARIRDSGWIKWLFILPTLAFFIVYVLGPVISVIYLSFTDTEYLTGEPGIWVGFENYYNALQDPLMAQGLWRAAQFTMMFLPGTIIVPLFLAILIDRVKHNRLATIYRVILLIPAVIPSTLVFTLWKWMYNFQIGPFNSFLVNVLHVFTLRTAPQWLGGGPLTLPAIAVMEVWWGLGYHSLFFLAGLAAIPKDLFEAARVDGANEWQLFWNVTLPRLQPIMAILVVLRFGSAMAVIDEYLIFGGFNRATPTYTWTVFMYDQSFKLGLWRQGFGAAIGMIGALAMMIVVAILLYIFRNRD
jgi:multiple sugar transport system permease protein